MASVPPTDWAWPRLLDSLQRDIIKLQETVEDMRRDAEDVREAHRKELDTLIEQLRSIQVSLSPIVKKHETALAAGEEMRRTWVNRSLWAITGAIALIVIDWIKAHITN